jgi:carbamoyltransferase
MSYNILGINMGQHGSATLLSDGVPIYFLEEERLSRYKRDSNPFRVILNVLSKYKVDEVILAGVGEQSPFLSNVGEDMFTSFIRKFNPKIKSSFISNQHHLTHTACAFYNSGFKEAIGIVIDGCGSRFKIKNLNIEADEAESIFLCSYKDIKKIHGVYKNSLGPNIEKYELTLQNTVNIAHAYEAITSYLGFAPMEGGKTMGLSSYGKKNKDIPDFLIKGKFNKNLFSFNSYIPNFQHPVLDPLLLKEFSFEDLAWKIQTETQQLVGDYIEKSIQETGLKQICCAGGYFLNCVANYYLIKRFPDVEFYFEPMSYDGGVSLGAALYRWYELNPNSKPYKQTTLYHGPQYSKEQLLEGIQKYVSN